MSPDSHNLTLSNFALSPIWPAPPGRTRTLVALTWPGRGGRFLDKRSSDAARRNANIPVRRSVRSSPSRRLLFEGERCGRPFKGRFSKANVGFVYGGMPTDIVGADGPAPRSLSEGRVSAEHIPDERAALMAVLRQATGGAGCRWPYGLEFLKKHIATAPRDCQWRRPTDDIWTLVIAAWPYRGSFAGTRKDIRGQLYLKDDRKRRQPLAEAHCASAEKRRRGRH